MKLDRLTSTTQSLPRETAERAREGAVGVRWRVDAAQGADGDRERSLQQELEAGKAKRSGSDDETQPLQEARAVAASLVYLGDGVRGLLRPALAKPLASSVDTEA